MRGSLQLYSCIISHVMWHQKRPALRLGHDHHLAKVKLLPLFCNQLATLLNAQSRTNDMYFRSKAGGVFQFCWVGGTSRRRNGTCAPRADTRHTYVLCLCCTVFGNETRAHKQNSASGARQMTDPANTGTCRQARSGFKHGAFPVKYEKNVVPKTRHASGKPATREQAARSFKHEELC